MKKLWHFFLQFLHITEISQKMYNTRTLIPAVPCISQILTTINLYFGKDLGFDWSINAQKAKSQTNIGKDFQGKVIHPPPPPLL